VNDVSLDAWKEMLRGNDPQSLEADALIFPPADLGQLAARNWLLPAPDYVLSDDEFASGDLALSDIFMSLRRGVMTWGESTLCLPLTSGQVVVAGDKSLLLDENSATRMATWDDLSKVLESANRPTFAQPLGQGWGGRMLLVRVAAYVKEPGRYADFMELGSLRPLIAEPPFEKALSALVADQRHALPEAIHWTPMEVMQAVKEGKAQLGLGVIPSRVGDDSGTSAWGYSSLPGSLEVYQFTDRKWSTREKVESVPVVGMAGHSAGVVTGTRRQKVAWSVLVQLTGKRWGTDICREGAFASPFRISQAGAPAGWLQADLDDELVNQYGASIRQMLSGSAVLIFPRIPGTDRYMAALDAAVLAAVRGEATPQVALSQAASEWDRITDELGRPRQAEHLLRHYGLSR
jgi:ABC-type glycerol-3-phosphate transport system substrate-binding protein